MRMLAHKLTALAVSTPSPGSNKGMVGLNTEKAAVIINLNNSRYQTIERDVIARSASRNEAIPGRASLKSPGLPRFRSQ